MVEVKDLNTRVMKARGEGRFYFYQKELMVLVLQKENLIHVFDEDFSYREVNGNGLGLAFVRRKLSEWGGQAKIQSMQGVGTEIGLILPKYEVLNEL